MLFIFILIFFSFCITSFTSIIFKTDSFPKSISSPLSDNNNLYYIQTNLTKIGQGKNYDCYENTWGTKIQYNLNQNSHIIWEIPGLWIGYYLNVTITGLKEILSSTQYETAIQCLPDFSGTIVGGNLASTNLKDDNMYNWTWRDRIFPPQQIPLNFTLIFQIYTVQSSISNFKIVTYSYWNDTGSIISPVSYYIHNFKTGGNDPLEQTPLNIIDWKNHTISTFSDISKYISSNGEIWIQFYAASTGSMLQAGYFYLDFLCIEINANYKWIRPEEDANLRLDTHIVQGSYGYGYVNFLGSWKDNPQYFHFSANFNVIFNVTSTFWMYQNKIGAVNSTYYLNLTQYIPYQHQWKLKFYQDPFPSANFTNFNFTISIIPIDWSYINATNPQGFQKILILNSVSGGKSLLAGNDSIYHNGGNWTIFCKSPNYINNVQLWKNSVLLPPNPKLVIWDKLDIQANFSHRILNGRVNLTVSFENKINKSDDQSGISGLMKNFNWQINSTANKNGTYLITISFFNYTEIGIYSCFINVYFPTKLSIISPKIPNLGFMKGESLNLTGFFENLYYPGNYYKEKGIQNATLYWIISNSTYNESGNLAPKYGGYYNSILNTASLKIMDGLYNLTITAEKVGYANQSSSIYELRCFEKLHPTKAAIKIPPAVKNIRLLSGMNYSCWVYPNQSISIQLNYTDIFKSPFLIDYASSQSFLYNSKGVLLSSYNSLGIRSSPSFYIINITNLNLHTGRYTLLINLSKTLYLNSSIWVNYTIKALEATIKVSKLYATLNITVPYIEWENLTISFKVEYKTTKYYQFNSWIAPINWGLVRYFIVFYGRSIFNSTNILKTGIISINEAGIFEMQDLHLSTASGSFQPGNYQVYITCNATDCQAREYNFNLTIRKKISTNLVLMNYPERITVDQRITLKAVLSSTELPQSVYFNQQIIYFNITVHFNSHNSSNFQIQDAVNQYAEAEISFYLADYISAYLDDVSYLEINAYYKGFTANYPTYSFYPTTSSKIAISLSTPFNIMFIVYIVLGIVGGVATAFIIHRKILIPKQIKQTKNISYLFKSFKDIVSLENLFVIMKSTGECLITRTYSPEGITESMKLSLCKVIANYDKGDPRHHALCDLIRFEDNKILIDDGDFIRVAVTMGAIPSERLIRSLVRFVQYFELQNYAWLKNPTGRIEELQGIDELLDIQFGATSMAPYTLAQIKKLSGFEETLQLMVANLLTQHDYFLLSQLYAHAKSATLVDEVMIFKTIQDLMDKQVIVPYDKTKQKDGTSEQLVGFDFDRLRANITGTKNKALKALNEKRFEDAAEYYREAAGLAASVADFEAKEQFLKKMNECLAKVTLEKESKEYIPEEMLAKFIEKTNKTVFKKIPESSTEQISEHIPLRKMQSSYPSYLENVHKKSKNLFESEEFISEEPLEPLNESASEESDELTPFEKELAKQEGFSLKASELLLNNEETPIILEEPLPESLPPESKSPSLEDVFEILEQTKFLSGEEIPEDRSSSVKETSVEVEKKSIIEEKISLMEEKEEEIASVPDKELKQITTLFPELEEEEEKIEREKKTVQPTQLKEILTDKTLGIKQHCPYCKHIIPENVMNLLRKGFEPECPNCGELIKSSNIHLD